MSTYTIDLPPEAEDALARLAANDMGTESEIVAFALQVLLRATDDGERARYDAMLDSKIQEGLDDIAAGRTYPAEQVFRELREKIERIEAERVAAE